MGLLDTLKGAYNKYTSGAEPSSGSSFQEIPDIQPSYDNSQDVALSRAKAAAQNERLWSEGNPLPESSMTGINKIIVEKTKRTSGRIGGGSRSQLRQSQKQTAPIVEDSSVYGTDTTVQNAADLIKTKATASVDKLKSIYNEYKKDYDEYQKERAADQTAQQTENIEPKQNYSERLSGAFKRGVSKANKFAEKSEKFIEKGAGVIGAGVDRITQNQNLRNNLGLQPSASNDEYIMRLNETIMATQNDINTIKGQRVANETRYRELISQESDLMVERKAILSVNKKDRTAEQNTKLNDIERKLTFIGNYESIDGELKKLEEKRQTDQLNLMNQRNNYIIERNSRMQQQRGGRSEIGRRLQNIGDATTGQFAPSLPRGIGEGLNTFGYNRGTGMADNLQQVVGGVNGRQPMYERLSSMVNTRGAGDTSGMRAMTDALVTVKQNKVVSPFGAPGIASEGVAAKEFDKTVPFRRIMLSDVGVGINARIIPKQFRQNVINNTVRTNIDTKPQPLMLQPLVQEQTQDQEIQYRNKKGSKSVVNRFHEKGMAAVGNINSTVKLNGLVNFRKESVQLKKRAAPKIVLAKFNTKSLKEITDNITKVADKTVNKKRIGKKK